MIKRLLILLLLIGATSFQGKASHLMGGEITWECLPSGAFQFRMILYRDCNGVPGPGVASLITNAPVPGGSIALALISQTDVTPAGCGTSCAAPGPLGGNVEEFVFQSAPIFITGVPPATGWYFTYDNCCRNAAIDNLVNPQSNGMTLRAWMYPYNGQNTNPCFDSSPLFVESPNTIICTGYTFTYNHNAQDPELDSLVYTWDIPLDDYFGIFNPTVNPAAVAWAGGYTTNSQLPGPLQNPTNTGASLDPNTGEVVYLSNTSGNFVTVVKVSAFKCGQLVAEIFREIQVVLLACPNLPNGLANQPPTVTAPFFDPITLGPLYTDTVTAGDSVWFFMSATDFELNAGGIPQTLTILGSGSQFGAGFTNPNAGCLNPPCAVVSPAFPIAAPFGAGVNFGWQTDCAHLGYNQGCINLSNTFTFVVRVQDDFCPAPGINVSTITIVVQAPPLVNEPEVRCAEVLANGDVTLSWTAPIDTFNSFYQYQLYSDYLAPGSGAYTLVDTVQIFNQTSYTHVGANAQNQVIDYYLRTRSGCNKERYSDSTDARIATMNLTVNNIGNGVAGLNWNAMLNPAISSWANYYQIYKRTPTGAWNFVDSTMALTFNDTIQDICKDTLYYKIELRDSSGCVSVSSEDSAVFINVLTPDPPDLKCIEVLANGNVIITWEPPSDTASAFDGYFIYMDDGTGYTLIDSIFNYNTTSYTDGSVNANAGTISYYMETRTLCNSQISTPGNILQTMTLTVSNLPAGSATLNWNAYYTTLGQPASNLGWYYIYREFASNPGVWTLIDSVPLPTVTAVLPITDICVENINYRIETVDAFGCSSVSTVDGDLFSIILTPDPPELRCVAVNPNGTVTISWAPPADTASSFDGYFIYQANGGAYTLIDSLPSYGTTSYTDLSANANANGMYTYYLSTLTSCARTFSQTSDTLQTMILTVNNAPAGTASLNWNSIHTPSLASTQSYYKIYMQNPCTTGPWTLLDSTMATNYSQAITNLSCIDDVCFRIEVGDDSGCNSVSTVDNDQFASVLVPDPPTVNCVVVLPNGTVNITFTPPLDTVLSFGGYFIYSSPTGLPGTFTLIDSVFNYFQTSYNHIGANAQTATVYYQIETRSGCNNTIYSAATPTFQSIKLDVVNVPLGTAALTWNSISTPLPPGSGAYYYIYKQQPAGVGPFVLIDSVAVPTTNFNDPIVNITCQDNINYQVQIAGPTGCLSISSIDGDLFYDPSVPDAPDVRCVEVLANGDVTITWLAPADTVLKFGGYFLYDGAGVVIDSIFNYNQLSYTIVGAGANAASVDYYMQTRSGCGSIFSAQSPTLSSIYLTAVNNGAGGAQLNWNAIANPVLASTNATYDVYKQNPAGTGAWVLLTSTANINYLDPILDVCQGNIDYRIEIGDASGCNSISNVDGDYFRSQAVPDAPDLRCVEVLANGDVSLTWLAPADTVLKFGGYFVYDGAGTLIDSIFNYAQSNYTVVGANGNTGSRSYYMQTLSGCDRIFSVPSATLSSIYLTAVNNGAGTGVLNWTAISNPVLPSTNANYDVYKQYPAGAPWVLLTSTANTNFNDVIVGVCQDSINYRIEIGDVSGCISISNVDGDWFKSLEVPEPPLVKCVNVDPGGDVTLSWVAPLDTGLKFNSYQVYTSASLNGPYTLHDSIFNYNQTSYAHLGANAQVNDVYYFMTTKTGCSENFSPNSDSLRSMRMTATNNGFGSANLSWNDIHNPKLATSSGNFDIYRQVPAGTGPWTLLATTTNLNYFDSINDICSEMVAYRVEQDDASGCTSVSSIDDVLIENLSKPEAPDFRCVSVLPNGDIELTWIQPLDTVLRFNSYHIYGSTDGTNFSLVDSIFNYNTTSYTQIAANGQNQSVYYYMETRSGCGVRYSDPSVTLRSIKLDVNNGGGFAQLAWNDIASPRPSTSASFYSVYQEYPAGIWTLVDTVNGNNYLDTITICSAIINYRVEISDDQGCISVSSIDGDLFEDIIRPNPPLMDTVSVDVATHNVHISWNPSTSADTEWYIVRQFNGTSWDSIGFTFGINSTYFLNVNANPGTGFERYRVQSVDSCGNRSFSPPAHRTIFAEVSFDKCDESMTIDWTEYINMEDGIDEYQIYASEDNQAFTLLGSVTSNQLTYKHTGLNDGSFYCYYVQAVGNIPSKTSRSNKTDTLEADLLTDPEFAYLNKATVITNNIVYVECLVDTAADISYYKLVRSDRFGGPFITVSVNNNVTDPNISFFDYNAYPDQTSLYYLVVAVNPCGEDVYTSNYGRTIHLTAKPENTLRNVLKWNNYGDWLAGVKFYHIFRNINGVWDPNPIANVPFGVREFVDDVSDFYQLDGNFGYYVEAVEDFGNPLGFRDTSRSNVAQAVQAPWVYIPNAFTPGGKNPVFNPLSSFTSAADYNMQIFNKWGEKLFETDNPNIGWDGSFDSEIAPQGAYVYLIKVQGFDGTFIERTGTVTLLR